MHIERYEIGYNGCLSNYGANAMSEKSVICGKTIHVSGGFMQTKSTQPLSGLVNELGLHDGNVEALSNGVNELFQQVASISTSIEVGLTLNFLVR